MLFLLISSIMCMKTYNIIADHDSEMFTAQNSKHPNILDIIGPNDGKVRKTRVGYTIELSDQTFNKMKKHPRIKHIEEDKQIKMADIDIKKNIDFSFVFQKNPAWGLSKISGHDETYEYLKDGGSNVIVYVLDTGLDVYHPEFEGRAFFRYNAVENSPDMDEQGHGTHCAGIIGSKTYGVAKKAKIFGVKILDKNGYGSISKLIEGIDFVIDDVSFLRSHSERFENLDYFIRRPRSTPFPIDEKFQIVVNMSVGGEKSLALNYAISNASKEYQIHFSTAAGNEHKDACSYSPSSSSSSLTIGASDSKDFIADFSNNGKCVNLFAPGVDVVSTWPRNRIKVASGTSMATPHVAGIMAVYLSLANFTPAELKTRILNDAEFRIKEQGYLSYFSRKKPFASLKSLYDRLKAMD